MKFLLVFLILNCTPVIGSESYQNALDQLLISSTISENEKFHNSKKTIVHLIEKQLISPALKETSYLSMISEVQSKYFWKFDLHYWKWLTSPLNPGYTVNYSYWYQTQMYTHKHGYEPLLREFSDNTRPRQSMWNNQARPSNDFWASFSRYLSLHLDKDNNSVKRKEAFLSYFITMSETSKNKIKTHLKAGIQRWLEVLWERFKISEYTASTSRLDLSSPIYPQIKDKMNFIGSRLRTNVDFQESLLKTLVLILKNNGHSQEYITNLVEIVKSRIVSSLTLNNLNTIGFRFEGLSNRSLKIIKDLENYISENINLTNMKNSYNAIESSSDYIDILTKY